MTGVLFILSVLLSVTLAVAIKRLFQYDRLVSIIGDGLAGYESFIQKKISNGLLEDHPEIVEFHRETLLVLNAVKAWSKVVATDSDGFKKSTANLMGTDPGKG